MFTGIVEEAGRVVSLSGGRLVIAADVVSGGIRPGDSVNVNGACLTVTAFTSNSFTVEVMPETLRRTSIGLLKSSDMVNLERAVTPTGLLGGHLVQGHVDGTAKIVSITPESGALVFRFEAPEDIIRYTVLKGFVAVDGVSLTITDKDMGSFAVSVVGYTREHTTLATRRVGDKVNIEVDIIAKYVEQFSRQERGGITADFLKEHGFAVN
jgi:riboflavin synthase